MQLLAVVISLFTIVYGSSSVDVWDTNAVPTVRVAVPLQAVRVTDQDVGGGQVLDRGDPPIIGDRGNPPIIGRQPKMGELDPGEVEIWDLNEETRMSTKIARVVAILWITLVASLPCVITRLEGRGIERTQMILFCSMWTVFFAGIWLFTHRVVFQSVHFTRIRSLSLIEAVYFMSQILTTVGYGDITPAKPAGQVVVGAYCLFSFMVIATIVTTTSELIVSTVTAYSQKMEQAAKKAAKKAHEAAHKAHEAARHAAHVAHEKVRMTRRASGIHDFSDIEATPENTPRSTLADLEEIAVNAGLKARKPQLEHQYMLRSLAIYFCCVLVGVAFFTNYPGENKTLFQAFYMSVITLSTVGFGAFTPVTEVGLVFGAFWMVFGSMALGSVVGSFIQWQEQIKQRELWNPTAVVAKQQQFLLDMPQEIDRFQFLQHYLIYSSTLSSSQLSSLAEFVGKLPVEKKSGEIDKRSLQKEWNVW